MDSPTVNRRQAVQMLAAGSTLSLAELPTSIARAAAPRNIQGANWSEPLAAYIVNSQTAVIPENTRELARRHLLDTLAAIIACRDLEPAALARRFILEQSAASGAPILGTRAQASPLDAIFASAMTAHAAEINDFCPSAFTQPGASIVPATLCLGAAREVSGEALLRAIIVGYEIACRLPKALGITNLRNAALANHSVGPLFGAAAAVASLLGLPRERLVHVFSYCVQQASGSWQWLRDVAHVEKAFAFAGMPARRGAECALLAAAGFTGVGDPFQGEPGWLNASMFTSATSDFDAAYMTEQLGERFELPLVGYKRYPVGGPTQAVIELLLGLIREVPAARVRRLRIEMPGRAEAFATAAMPALNLPYLCSIILADGKLDFVAAQSRERLLEDARIRAFMPNVSVVHDPRQEAEPRVESARVIATLDDDSTLERFLNHVKGFPSDPFDRDDVATKAMELAAPHLGAARAQRLCNTIWQLERVSSVRQIVRQIAR